MSDSLRVDILTLHPAMFAPLEQSILKRAQESALLEVHLHNMRDFGLGRYQHVDDTPYGGGSGMLLRVDVVDACLRSIPTDNAHILLMDPVGKPFVHQEAVRLAQKNHLVFICGHYKGIDARVREYLVDEAYSIGDFVLTGGELPAMVMIDSISRQIKGVLGNEGSLEDESFCDGLLEAPQYTRPREYQGWAVPDVLFSGHHAQIAKWRKEQSIKRTQEIRPDLIKKSFDRDTESE